MRRIEQNLRRRRKGFWANPVIALQNKKQLEKLLQKQTDRRRRKKLQVVIDLLAGKMTAKQIAKKRRVSRATVFNDKQRYEVGGIWNLLEESRPGRPSEELPNFVRDFFKDLLRANKQWMVVYSPRFTQIGFDGLGYKCSVAKIRRLLRRFKAADPESAILKSFRPSRAALGRGLDALKQGMAGLYVHRHKDAVAILPWPDPSAPKPRRVFRNDYTGERFELEDGQARQIK